MGAKYENGTWVIEGDIPHAITTAQTESGLVFFSAEGEAQPECFGIWWEGVGSPNAECMECVFSDLCLEKMSKTLLPEAKAKLKGNLNLESLARVLDVNQQAVLLIMEQASSGTIPKKKKRAPVHSSGTAKAVSLGETGPPDPMEEPDRDPCQAPSAKSAVGGAQRKKAKSAKPAKRRGAPKKPWGEHTYLKRFLRERIRNELIAKIPIGHTLETTYKGDTYQTTCLKNGWEYQGQRFPTLQAVTEVIAGKVVRPGQVRNGKLLSKTRKICNWSAAKFWKLAKVTEELGLSSVLDFPGTQRSKTG